MSKSVVLPEPVKPVRIVMGRRPGAVVEVGTLILQSGMLGSSWHVCVDVDELAILSLR